MSADQRNEAYDWLQKNAWTSFALVDHWHIDRHNIYQATLYGMRQTWLKLRMTYPHVAEQIDRITVDAMPLKLVGAHPPIHSFCYGETYSMSIAAASIIAKVTRDRLMQQLDPIVKGYGLSQHKGYGTADHCASLSVQGASLIHRASFIDHFVRAKDTQKGIFDL
jgi:ribonuclease HII